jgi:pimeloyl-ACP methyl ester carboxylesterase
VPYATIHGIRLFYKDVGAGRPLVLVPGLGADSTAYNLVIPHLRRRLRAIAPDPRGLGRSADAPDPLSTQAMAQDLCGLLDHLGVPRASFLGSSMGALIVRRLATLYADRLDRLVLCAAGIGNAPYAGRIRALLRALVRGAPPADLMRHILTLILSPEFIDKNEVFLQELEGLLGPDKRALRMMERQLAVMEAEAADEMGPIHAPVLLIAGAQDRLVPLHHVRALKESLPRSTLLVLEQAGHHPFLEASQETLEGLMAFLQDRG